MSEQETNEIKIEGFDGFDGFEKEEEKEVLSIKPDEVEAEAEAEVDDGIMKNIELKDIKIVDIIHVSPLEPMIIYVKTEEKDGSSGEVIGICGFYDPANKQFVLSEVKPVNIDGFDEAFKSFIERKQKEKQTEVEGESKSK